MNPISARLNMHYTLQDGDVNLLERLKELYFLHYPHFPIPCGVLLSLYTVLANHIFWTALMSHLSLLQRQRSHSVVQQLNVYISSVQPLSCQPCTAEPLSYNST